MVSRLIYAREAPTYDRDSICTKNGSKINLKAMRKKYLLEMQKYELAEVHVFAAQRPFFSNAHMSKIASCQYLQRRKNGRQ